MRALGIAGVRPAMRVLSGLVVLAACGGEDPNGAPGPSVRTGAERFLIGTQVSLPDGRLNFFNTVDALDETTEIDLNESLEVPGFARIYAPDAGGYFGVGSNETLTVTRFDLDSQDRLVETDRVSFRSSGTTFLLNQMVFISESKAYYIDTVSAQVVVWNPETMEVEDTIDLSMRIREDRPPSTIPFVGPGVGLDVSSVCSRTKMGSMIRIS